MKVYQLDNATIWVYDNWSEDLRRKVKKINEDLADWVSKRGGSMSGELKITKKKEG